MSQNKKKAAAAKKSRINAGKQNSGGIPQGDVQPPGAGFHRGTESQDRSPVGRSPRPAPYIV